jgi:hypothetical protein
VALKVLPDFWIKTRTNLALLPEEGWEKLRTVSVEILKYSPRRNPVIAPTVTVFVAVRVTAPPVRTPEVRSPKC